MESLRECSCCLESDCGQRERAEIKIIGASRTDRGVHAKHQVANFKTEVNLDVEEIKFRLNQLLDNDIYIFKIKSVQLNFHARYWAREKTYRYYSKCTK